MPPIPPDEKPLLASLPVALGAGIGSICGPFLLAIFQKYVFAPIKLTADKKLAGIVGLTSVATAGYLSSLACVKTITVVNDLKLIIPPRRYNHSLSVNGLDHVICAGLYVLTFKILGGRFASVLPSNLLKPGAFAKGYIAASLNYAGPKQRELIQQLGRRFGCHSCGKRRRAVLYICDHQPPIAVMRRSMMRRLMKKQRFYPQCLGCSSKQANCLSKPDHFSDIVTHGSTIRLYKLWPPAPVIAPYICDIITSITCF